MNLSIIIPAFRETPCLSRLLHSIEDARASLPADAVEVLVVDDGSDPPIREAVAPFGVQYHYKAHAGPAAARNYGATRARGEAYLFLDSDTELLPDTLDRVLQTIRRSDFAVSSIPYHPRSANAGVVPEFKGLFDAYNVWYRVPRGPIQIINGSSVIFRKAVFHELKGWDESPGRSECENEEFSVRIKGYYPIVHEPDIFVSHNFPRQLTSLLTTIFVRSIAWTSNMLSRKVEFDGLTRTRTKGFLALTPLASVVGLVGALVWPPALWVSGAALIAFVVGNADFLLFMRSSAGTFNTIRYTVVHFLFTLAVGAGGVVGLVLAGPPGLLFRKARPKLDSSSAGVAKNGKG